MVLPYNGGKHKISNHNIKPSRWYYGLAILVFIIGGSLFALFLFKNLNKLTDSLTQLIVPGKKEVTLSEPGKYTIFYEYQSVVGNKVYSTEENLSGLECALVSKTTGSQIPLSHSSMNSTYSVGGRSGLSVLEFLIEKPGLYELSAWYPEGKEGTEVVLAIGRGFTGKLVGIILSGLAILFGFLIVGVTIAVKTFLKRRKAERQME